MKELRWNYIKLISGVIAISFSPLAVKMVGFTPGVSAFYRSFYAGIFFLILALLRYLNTREAAGNSFWLLPSILAGVFLGVDLFVWHKTILYVGAGPATFLGNSQILFVTVFAALFFKERIPLLFYLILAMVITGLYFLIPSITQGVSRPVGYLMGLIVGITYAGMLICLRYAKMLSGERDYPELFSLAVVFLSSVLVIFLAATILDGNTIFVWNLKDHILMAITGLFCQTLGWYFINSNILKLPAHEGSLLLMLQPLFATVWGCIFFLEPLSGMQVLGVFLALSGIVWYQMTKKESSIQKSTETAEVI